MHRVLLCWVTAALVVLGVGCHPGQVRLRVSPLGERREWRTVIPAEEFRKPSQDLLYLPRPPLGYAAALQQPPKGFVLNAKLRWDDAVRPLRQCFDRLCKQHNEARVTVEEFGQRKAHLTEIVRQLTEDEQELKRALDEYKKEESTLKRPQPEQGEMTDEEVRIRARMKEAREAADAAIDRAAERVERLEGQ